MPIRPGYSSPTAGRTRSASSEHRGLPRSRRSTRTRMCSPLRCRRCSRARRSGRRLGRSRLLPRGSLRRCHRRRAGTRSGCTAPAGRHTRRRRRVRRLRTPHRPHNPLRRTAAGPVRQPRRPPGPSSLPHPHHTRKKPKPTPHTSSMRRPNKPSWAVAYPRGGRVQTLGHGADLRAWLEPSAVLPRHHCHGATSVSVSVSE